MSVLLKSIKYQLFKRNKIFNQAKNVNFIVPFQNSLLYVQERNMSSQNIVLQKNIKILRRIMFQKKSFEKSRLETTLHLIETKDDLIADEALLLLKCCDKILDCLPQERLEFGEYLWNYLSVCNVPWNVHHYNELLNIYLNNNKIFSPLDFIQNMHNKNVIPNTTTYERCIQYYCERGQVINAKYLISSKNLKITKKIYNSLMWGHYQNGDMEAALAMFEKNIFASDSEIHIILMTMYAQQNKIHKILEIIKVCKLKNIPLSNENILNVIYALPVKYPIKDISKILIHLDRRNKEFCFNEIQILTKLIYREQLDIIKFILSDVRDTQTVQILLKHMVLSNMNLQSIESMCNFLEIKNLCSNPLLWALYYSYSQNDENLCLSLLKLCKVYCTVKPHYFWPLLIKKGEMYDFQGVLNIIKIMIDDFNISPCVDTLYDYVLPFTYTHILATRDKLVLLGMNVTVLNNAIILSFLKNFKMQYTLDYMNTYPDQYMYTIVQYAVRKCLLYTNQINDFISISTKLVDTDPCTQAVTPVPMDKQLLDFLFEYPLHTSLINKVIIELSNEKRIKINKLNDYDLISSCINECIPINYKMHYL